MSNPARAPNSAKPRPVPCPACGGPSLFTPDNHFRPFCSERCKLHDLGAWANESFRVQVEEDDGAESGDATRLQ